MSDQTLEVNKEQTTAPVTEDSKNQDPTQGTEDQPVYTKEQFNAAMKSARISGEQSVAKKFSNVDVEHYNSLIQKEEQSKLEEQKKKGEFEKILKEQAEKAQSKISTLTDELTKIKVDGALLNAASKHKAVNPEQVVQLVRNQVKMSETGQVEIVDPKSGNTRYTEAGEPLDVENAVSDWLKANPHFVQAGPTGSGATSNQNPEGVKQVDLDKLDLTKAKDREIYKQHRAKLFGNNIG
jgi:flagellar biosynthesis GTPase FlhF